MQYYTWRHVHVIRTSSAHRLRVIRMHICRLHQDTSSAHCLQAICTTPHGHRGPELSFTVSGICYWMEFVAGMLNCFISGSCKWFARWSVLLGFSACQIWTLFTSHLHMYMSSAYYLSICVLCTYYLQWSLISSFLTDNANVIHTSSLELFIYSIMENMSSAPLPDDMSFAPLPDDVSSAPLSDDMSSAPLPDDMSSAPLPDDMSFALQRNMSYLFEVWEASNRSTRQLVWFIWLFDWLA